jgi:hypothetical protein
VDTSRNRCAGRERWRRAAAVRRISSALVSWGFGSQEDYERDLEAPQWLEDEER